MKEDVKKYNHWSTDLKKTIPALKQIPKLFFNNEWTVESIEENKNVILKKLDSKCGIDWIVENKEQIITVASRIQFGNNWGSFTIREQRYTGTKTEYQKRVEAIEKGYLYPLYTCQCYFKDDYTFLGGAIMRTVDLYKSLENGCSKKKSDNIFKVKYFNDIQQEGFKIKIINNQNI
jgi:hypothetical protein